MRDKKQGIDDILIPHRGNIKARGMPKSALLGSNFAREGDRLIRAGVNRLNIHLK
jgi:hypothetical protein